MKKSLKLQARLDNEAFDKIKSFAVLNDTSQSEIVRVLIEKSNVKINVRNRKTITDEAKKKGTVNTNLITVDLTDKLLLKIKNMRLKNNTSYSEIIRQLIHNTDFSKLTFKTIGENILAGKGKKGK